MQPAEIDRLYQEGVAALRAGDKAAGREKLMRVVEADQLHENAWLWHSGAVETDDERIICLENVPAEDSVGEFRKIFLKRCKLHCG